MVGRCAYCGQKAGFFSTKHKECAEKHALNLQTTEDMVVKAFAAAEWLPPLLEARDFADCNRIRPSEYSQAIIDQLTTTVDTSLQRFRVTSQFVGQVNRTVKEFTLDLNKSSQTDLFYRLEAALVLADLGNGSLPTKFAPPNFLPPLNMTKDEKVVWVFRNVEFYEDRTHTKRVGGSRGMSVRVAKGVYYHTGRFASHTVSRVERDHIDTGDLVVATKALYFAGSSKGFRLPFNKIITLEPFSNGLGVIKDGVNAKYQLFGTTEGWFLFNLVSSVSRL